MSDNLEELIKLRQELHQHPELSGEEKNTANRIKAFLAQYAPDETIEGVGGTGLLFVYNGKEPGSTVVIRSELDALPIQEVNEMAYQSKVAGVSHKCGHDGHMVMVAGLAAYLKRNRPQSGKVILLFQPAEETGEGAERMISDPVFQKLGFDYFFALHNLPGYPTNQIVMREGTFASASQGLIVRLEGKTSHAAEPENGNSPALAMAKIVEKWHSLSNKTLPLSEFAIVTVVHAQLGTKAFGVSPGHAHIMATLRAYNDDDLTKLTEEASGFAKRIAEKYRLKIAFEKTEVFAATTNSEKCQKIISDAVQKNGFDSVVRAEPFRWSEDFGLFTKKYEGAMFGLGAGIDCPDLHNPDYDFPDQIISTGLKMFESIIDQIVNK
ncbi:MAG TPA: amidohydrolase [Fulvivirga sp.]|nr:amidohydrolase [Fulvivirga sp.]